MSRRRRATTKAEPPHISTRMNEPNSKKSPPPPISHPSFVYLQVTRFPPRHFPGPRYFYFQVHCYLRERSRKSTHTHRRGIPGTTLTTTWLAYPNYPLVSAQGDGRWVLVQPKVLVEPAPQLAVKVLREAGVTTKNHRRWEVCV